jgi:monofunctional biosynthetic peptidoglycan transglycosylase
MKSSNGKRRIWRLCKRIVLGLFIAQLLYIVALRWVNPPFTLTMVASRFRLMGSGTSFHKRWVPYDRISVSAKLAVMAGEDQLFPVHHGFDVRAIEKAWRHNKHSARTHGASTISQQTAKNVFLWQGGGWFRKGLEVYFTFMIEKIWGKKRILEVYLNVAQTGKGVFGFEAAAEQYFGEHAAGLSRAQAALVAAGLPNPLRYSVRHPSPYMQQRQQWILGQMSNLDGAPDIMALLDER